MAAIIGLIVYKKFKNSHAKYFIWFICTIPLIEIFGGYPWHLEDWGLFHLIEGTVFERNYWWFTLFWTMGSALFYSWYLEKVIANKMYSILLRVSRYVFFVISILVIVTNIDEFFLYNLSPIVLGGTVLIILSCFLYFLEILTSDKILDFYRSINFYISATLFIWFLITSTILFFDKYFNDMDWNFVLLKWQVFLISNIFMYSIFTFALLWSKPEKN
tara:strand:+ start:4879 stop:5529 length:651 start_codon:yes stop_codon:yes gene_type:complete